MTHPTLLNGVTRRFPALKFAFLEGGVGWACTLYSDLIGHWKRRNRQALEYTNPANLNLTMLAEYFQRYGSELLTTHGVLHLAGYDDRDPVEADLMHRRERDLLGSAAPARLWKGLLPA